MQTRNSRQFLAPLKPIGTAQHFKPHVCQWDVQSRPNLPGSKSIFTWVISPILGTLSWESHSGTYF